MGLVAVALLLAASSLHGQGAGTLRLGGPAEARLRTEQILGLRPTDGFLLRTPDVLWSEAQRRPLSWVLPQGELVWNSDLPFGMNDGTLWAGRGASGIVRAGVRAEWGRITVMLVPELAFSENEGFDLFTGADEDRSSFSSPWHTGRNSADLPLRFGDEPLYVVSPGQSSLTVRFGSVGVGAATESMWWGPGARSGIVMSSHAQGIPHLFLRTVRPVDVRIGLLEARWIAGALTESLYFDSDPDNDLRSLSGLVVVFRPRFEPELALGFARTVMDQTDGSGEVLGHALDVFTAWNGLPDVTTGESTDPEELFSAFGRWVFPASGLEVYGEWARMEFPGPFADLMAAPQHTQGYTVGLQWARPLKEEAWPVVRIHGELTYLEQTHVLGDRPPPSDYYTSARVPQGYTQRGQVVGAGIGPGSSSQWLAGDYMARDWELGGFMGRVRHENDAFYREEGADYLSHDVSLFFGVRAGVLLPWADIHGEVTGGKRFNYLFQNGHFNPGGFRTVDVRNWTFRLHVRPGR